MRLLRIEHPVSGCGPYTGRQKLYEAGCDKAAFMSENMHLAHSGSPNHPAPSIDFPEGLQREHLDAVRYGTDEEREIYAEDEEDCAFDWTCAFSSLDQLNAWFTPADQRLLIDAGFELVAIELHGGATIADSGRQVVYRPEQVEVRAVIDWPGVQG